MVKTDDWRSDPLYRALLIPSREAFGEDGKVRRIAAACIRFIFCALFGWLIAMLGLIGGKAPKKSLVYEHAEGDWNRGYCLGPPVRCWEIQGSEVHERECVTEFDQGARGVWFAEFSIIRFCIAQDRSKVIWSSHHGPRAGSGVIFTVHDRGAEVTLEPGPRKWIS